MKPAGIIAGIVLFSGCKEIPPMIDFGPQLKVDTSYVISPVPATDPHQVLAEEFRSPASVLCQQADQNLASENTVATPVTVMVLVPAGPQTTPLDGSVYDLEDSGANYVATEVYGGVNTFPTVGIDRVPFKGAAGLTAEGIWDAKINNQENAIDSLNLQVTSSYNVANAIATATVTVTYTQQVDYLQHISLALVEDSITDNQTAGLEPDYLFNGVFRFMISGFTGDVINTPNPSLKQPGLVYQKRYAFAIPPVYLKNIQSNPPVKPANCRVIAFVTNSGTNGTVAQTAQVKLISH